jgi:hypothetical protein
VRKASDIESGDMKPVTVKEEAALKDSPANRKDKGEG